MIFGSLTFLIGEAGRNIRRNGLMSLAALGTVTIALTVLGGTLWTTFRMSEFARSQPEKFNRIDVFLPPKAERSKAQDLLEKLQNKPEVKEVTLVTREEAWKMMEESQPVLTSALDENPLMDKLEVELKEASQVSQFAQSLRDKGEYPNIDKVLDAGEEVRNLINLSRVIRVIGGGLAVGLFIATLFIIHNTIRLTVFARKKEILIMQMVGATPWFIRLPLLLEGLFHGLMGGVIAGGLMLFAGHLVSQFVTSVHSPLSGEVPSLLSPATVFDIIAVTGAFLGILGSHLAIRRFLRQL